MATMMMKQKTDIITTQQSIAVVKNMIRTSISEICYLRNVFDNECFNTKNYAGMCINALHPVDKTEYGEDIVKSEEAWQLTRWLEEGVFDALEKKYLRGIIFAIYDLPIEDEKSTLLEAYYYKISYPSSGDVTLEYSSTTQNESKDSTTNSQYSTNSIRNKVIIMIRTLITLCGTLQPLPEKRYITMKLYYYDDITPPDYQPSYFVDVSKFNTNNTIFQLKDDMIDMQIGNINTPYHTISMCIKTKDSCSSDTLSKDSIPHLDDKQNQNQDQNKEHTYSNINKNEHILEQDFNKLQNNVYISRQENITYDKSPQKININIDDTIYNNCVYWIYTNDLQYLSSSNLDEGIKQGVKTCRQLLQRLEKEGFLSKYNPKFYGRKVLHNEFTQRYIEELKQYIEPCDINKSTNNNSKKNNDDNMMNTMDHTAQRNHETYIKETYGTPSSVNSCSQLSNIKLKSNTRKRILIPSSYVTNNQTIGNEKCSTIKRPIEQYNDQSKRRDIE